MFWFQINGGDFLVKCGAYDCETIGCIVLFKVHLLSHDCLPDSLRELQTIAKNVDAKTVKKALAFFEKSEGGYYDKDIKSTKAKMLKIKAKRSENGKKGAVARWLKSHV